MEFLFGHSHSTLCSLELAALNRSSEHLRRAEAEMNEAVAQREVAGVARWLIENRETLLEAAHNSLPVIAVTKKLRLPKTCICGCPRLAHLRRKCKQHGCPTFSLRLPISKSIGATLIFFALLLCPLAHAQEPKSFVVPFRLSNSMILLEGKINGKISTFLLDTGANTSIVDYRLESPLCRARRSSPVPGCAAWRSAFRTF